MNQEKTLEATVPPSSKVPPETMELRARPRPVTRLNRRTLALLAGILAAVVLGATMWSLQTPKRRGDDNARELYSVDRVSKSEELNQLPADYSPLPAKPPTDVAPVLGPPLPGDLGAPMLKSGQVSSAPPVEHSSVDGEQQARQKEADDEAASPVFFRSSNPRATANVQTTPSSASSPSNTAFDPLAAGPASTTPQPTDPTTIQNRQDQKESFQKGGSTATRNSGDLQPPASPYQVMAGTMIAGDGH